MTFKEFWRVYDYKVGRIQCLKLWKRLTEGEKLQIMLNLPKYIENTHKDGRFPSRKHPKTYLRNKSWEDEITIVRANNSGGLSASVEKELNTLLERGSTGSDTPEMGGTSIEEEIQSRFGLTDDEPKKRIHRTIELPFTPGDPAGQ